MEAHADACFQSVKQLVLADGPDRSWTLTDLLISDI